MSGPYLNSSLFHLWRISCLNVMNNNNFRSCQPSSPTPHSSWLLKLKANWIILSMFSVLVPMSSTIQYSTVHCHCSVLSVTRYRQFVLAEIVSTSTFVIHISLRPTVSPLPLHWALVRPTFTFTFYRLNIMNGLTAISISTSQTVYFQLQSRNNSCITRTQYRN